MARAYRNGGKQVGEGAGIQRGGDAPGEPDQLLLPAVLRAVALDLRRGDGIGHDLGPVGRAGLLRVLLIRIRVGGLGERTGQPSRRVLPQAVADGFVEPDAVGGDGQQQATLVRAAAGSGRAFIAETHLDAGELAGEPRRQGSTTLDLVVGVELGQHA
ncbi:hypothetical protein ACFQS7_11775 [Dankookia sp. GCM10030260]|uniref:hypothetical protein n=1 Tax=Dankookia sp. GCM10030260 TaxID=3273390 RepID=UPI003614A8FB